MKMDKKTPTLGIFFYYSKIITKDGSQKRPLSPNTNVFKRKIKKLFTAARKSTKDWSKMYMSEQNN